MPVEAGMQARLLAWYDANKRNLPWRTNCDPYRVWVSEVMLQQTTVAAVIPFYERWMRALPNVYSLAEASEETVYALWQGLGYYRRCRQLHAGAKAVVATGFPQTAIAWLSIPGVGAYTAGALASIAGNQPAALVDGNVERVYARICDDDSPANLIKPRAWQWAREVLVTDRPGDWNQALMELGATICTPKNPGCPTCPISGHCRSFAIQTQALRPTPKLPVAWKDVELSLVVPCFKGEIGLEQRGPDQWWQGLWCFPAKLPDDCAPTRILGSATIRHTVTNHRVRLTCTAYQVDCQSEALRWMMPDGVDVIGLPAPIRKLVTVLLPGLKEEESIPD